MSIKIKIDATHLSIVGTLPRDVNDEIYHDLAYWIEGAQYTNAYNTLVDVVDSNGDRVSRRKWDGYKRLYQPIRQRCGAGLLSKVVWILEQNDIDFTIIDNRPHYDVPQPLQLHGVELRDYQNQIIDIILEKKRLRYEAPPRSGKTIVNIAAYARAPIGKLLFVVQQKELVSQTIQKFREHLPQISVGVISDGVADIQPDVNVATIQTLAAALGLHYKKVKGETKENPILLEKRLEIRQAVFSARIVVIDEAHHAAATTYVQLLQRVKSAEYIIGQSGTPHREDNTELMMESVIGPVEYKITHDDLLSKGYLVRPIIRFYKIPVHDIKSKHYQSIYSSNIIHHPIRNNIISKVSQALSKRNKSVVVAVSKKQHGKEISKCLDQMGVTHRTMFGEHTKKQRDEILQQLQNKDLLVVVSTLLHEGVDIPSLDAVIIAAGDKSAIAAFQRLRPMTPYPGKKSCYIIDFLDQAKYLVKHSKKRLQMYKQNPAFKSIEVCDV